MALARLSAIFVLILHLQNSHGQRALGNLPTLGLNNLSSSQQALQRKAGLISNPKNYNQIAKTGNIGSSFNIQQQNNNLNLQTQNNNLNLQQENLNLQQQNIQQSGLQQPINLEQTQNFQPALNLQQSNIQQAQNMQQPLNINLQQPLLNQNLQQSLNLQQNSQQQQCGVPTTSQPALNLQQSNIQQAQIMQQPLNINLQQPLPNQNLQQFLNLQQNSQQQQCGVAQAFLQQSNVQQAQNMQQPLNINLQQPLLNQNLQQSLNLQQNSQQQQCGVPITNLQLAGQQIPIQTSGTSFASLPVINGQLSGLPLQISQGVLLSNPGLTSSLSSFLPNTCGSKQANDQMPVPFPQNNALSFSNIPISVVDRSQTANDIPMSITCSSFPGEDTTLSNPSSLASMILPISLRTGSTCQKNQQTVDLVQNSLTTLQNQPIQGQLSLIPVSQPVSQMYNQQVATSAQSQSSPIASILLSQLQSPNTTPQYPTFPGYSASSIVNPKSQNRGPKSSNIKALLPLLLNLIKEKNGCGCPNCNNCGCIRNNNGNNNKQCKNVQEPQVFSGYSKQINYSDAYKDDFVNNVSSEEYDNNSVKPRDRTKYQRYDNRENKNGDSYEVDDEQIEESSYDDED